MSWPTAVAWGDIALGAGVLATAVVGWLAGRDTRKALAAAGEANALSARLATLEEDRRRSERVPRMSAQLNATNQDGVLLLSVWLDSAEPLSKVKVTVRETRNHGSPVGFPSGQNGVSTRPPGPDADGNMPDGIQPGWQSDSLRPQAVWEKRMVPGTAATWSMGRRAMAPESDGWDSIRLGVLCVAAADQEGWTVPVPVEVTERARRVIGTGRGSGSPLGGTIA